MDLFAEIRRLTIIALFSDDELVDQIVLKGGNALALIYGLSRRTSLDLDFSLAEDFADFEETKRRMFRSLDDRFETAGYVAFDKQFEAKPRISGLDERPWWGGYELRFKLLPKEKHAKLKGSLIKMQIDALPIGPDQERVFSVDFSKHEYTEGKQELELDEYTIYVYSPVMCAIEKLRAICQQMEGYPIKGKRQPRARDFYDIYLVVSKQTLDLSTEENLDLIRNVFAAKQVSLALLSNICNEREFHRPDWPAVVASVPEDLQEFDFYFDFVVEQANKLKALWDK